MTPRSVKTAGAALFVIGLIGFVLGHASRQSPSLVITCGFVGLAGLLTFVRGRAWP